MQLERAFEHIRIHSEARITGRVELHFKDGELKVLNIDRSFRDETEFLAPNQFKVSKQK